MWDSNYFIVVFLVSSTVKSTGVSMYKWLASPNRSGFFFFFNREALIVGGNHYFQKQMVVIIFRSWQCIFFLWMLIPLSYLSFFFLWSFSIFRTTLSFNVYYSNVALKFDIQGPVYPGAGDLRNLRDFSPNTIPLRWSRVCPIPLNIYLVSFHYIIN